LLAHTQLELPVIVLVDYEALKQANADQAQMQILLQQVTSLRQQGYRVTMPLTFDDRPAAMTHRLNFANNQWQLEAI
jgi:ATP phosphoribosyltransferase regulatory subunit